MVNCPYIRIAPLEKIWAELVQSFIETIVNRLKNKFKIDRGVLPYYEYVQILS